MQDFYWFIVFVTVNSTILLAFAVNVSRLRIMHKIAWGDGENKDLMKAIRVHSNGIEQVPIYALLLLSLSLTNTIVIALPALVIISTLSRLIHAYGILFKKPILRQVGAAITYISHGVATIALLSNLNA